MELLNENKVKLAETRERYQSAKTARDAEGMAAEARLIEALEILRPELEKEAAAELEAASVQRATKRMTAISRAHGSMVNELAQDEKRVLAKIEELQEAIAKLNERYQKMTTLRAEAAALSDRFGVTKLDLPTLVPPARRDFVPSLVALPDPLPDHPSIYQDVEDCEHKLRTRRTYAEVAGTESFKIISAAGLKAFPELNETQRQIVNVRQRQEAEARRSFSQYAGPDHERTWGK